MTSTNFAYWVQGYFEISYHVDKLSAREISMIRKHLDLVFKYDKEPSKFCNWLRGFLDALDKNTELTSAQTDKVKAELYSIFKHEIDPSYTSDSKLQNEMNEIHNSDNTFPYGENVRC